jgi:hypothetical protein
MDQRDLSVLYVVSQKMIPHFYVLGSGNEHCVLCNTCGTIIHSSANATCSSRNSTSARKVGAIIHSSVVVPENNYKVSEKDIRNLLKTHVIHFGPFAGNAHEIDKKSWNDKEITLDSNTSQKSLENLTKPRTALFHGGEDD